MTKSEAIAILEALANGSDPADGSPLSVAVLERPEVLRALFEAIRALEARAPQSASSPRQPPAGRPANVGRAWTAEEDAALSKAFDAGVGVAALSVRHGRTTGGIRSRLVKLGKLQVGEVLDEPDGSGVGRRQP